MGRSTIEQFNAFMTLFKSIVAQKVSRREAYEIAENRWIELHGSRKYRSYKTFSDMYGRNFGDRLRYTAKEPTTLEFIDIYYDIAKPTNTVRANYELAEQEYEKRHGSRRFSSYDVFTTTRSRYHRTGRIKQAA